MPGEEPEASLAYHDAKFLDGDAGRPIRILAEYLEPLERFRVNQVHATVVFFGSARIAQDGPLARYYAEARELARRVTVWSMSCSPGENRVVVCSGGGGGIMEAASRGAADAHGRDVGLNIGLPHEQRPNPYLTPELTFEFHYFFMRKLWFAHLARAVVYFPGGFGTLDEMFEVLTLAQTRKIDRKIVILLYGSAYWNEVIDFEALVRHGTISKEDLGLFRFVDDPAAAMRVIEKEVVLDPEGRTPSFAKSKTPPPRPHERARRP